MMRNMILIVGMILALQIVHAESEDVSTYCRYVPERSDDFAWENDLVAFRVYGPALARGAENSGIDCWTKRVKYPVVNKWYTLNKEQKISYHQDHGEGCDFYHVGKSRGCGGTAIWHNDRMILSNVYKKWKVLVSTPEKSVFMLTYEYSFDGRIIQEEKTVSVELGKHLFKSESIFTENGKPADLEIAVGLTTHDQRGVVSMDQTAEWMSVWEDHHGKNGKLGTGILMDSKRITSMQELKSKISDESHAVMTTHTDAKGSTVHYAGFAWVHLGNIKTQKQWNAYLKAFAESLKI